MNVFYRYLWKIYATIIDVDFYFSVYPPMPCTMTPEHQSKMLETMIHLRVDPVTGLTSKYDYANNRWKE